MKRLKRAARALFHQSLLAQGLTAVTALVTVSLLAQGMPTTDYAHYAVVTALWAIGNAVVGTGTGTRIAKMSADGHRRIRFQQSELWVAVAAAAGVGLYVGAVREYNIDALIAGLCMLSFVFAESSTSFELGAGRFNRYLIILATRALTPLLFLGTLFVLDSVTFTTAICSTFAANLISLSLWPGRWSAALERAKGISSHSVGAMNMALWIIASADRLILEGIVQPLELATYAMAYGLVDRVFRSLSNAYIARNLRRSFQGTSSKSGALYIGGMALIAVLLVPGVHWGTNILSGGRYVAGYDVAIGVVAAGLFMVWSAPRYVALMASGSYRSSMGMLGLLAGLNIGGNFIVGPYFGIVGAAFVSAATYLLWLIWLLGRSMHQKSTVLMIGRHVRVAA